MEDMYGHAKSRNDTCTSGSKYTISVTDCVRACFTDDVQGRGKRVQALRRRDWEGSAIHNSKQKPESGSHVD